MSCARPIRRGRSSACGSCRRALSSPRTKGGRRYYLYADPDYCKCVFVGDELAMKNYRDLVSPPPQAPMSIGPGKPSVASEMIQEMDPVLGGTIYDGDILDW